ncbi:hypothetical protein CLIB1423_04S01024 [[Candida] railenensis]|uniref:Uncharacterized protein n=1 Tax=[Candida] railenensis TaxID=45579 RepID=A0A9P0QN11_9ASCO|nr:hypothetical protein CLIB1423_04S01024 [[Candida] railenensis]
MTYTIGDRRISIEADHLPPETFELILSHPTLFKYCLNNVSYTCLIDLKKIIHLYGDVLTIYSTLLCKIPKYDDVTNFASRTQMRVLQLENSFNNLLGDYNSNNNLNFKESWDDKSYEKETRRACLLCIQSAKEVFAQVISCLNCIEVFFSTFDNLKKLLIPYLLGQAEEIHASLDKLSDWFSVVTIADDVVKIRSYKNDDSIILQQLKKIERITSGIERESGIFNVTFKTFDQSLKSYTAILLGRAILKRDIGEEQCQIIRRREVCFQAAEHVVNIPLHQDQLHSFSGTQIAKYAMIGSVVVFLLVSIVVYRLLKVLVW